MQAGSGSAEGKPADDTLRELLLAAGKKGAFNATPVELIRAVGARLGLLLADVNSVLNRARSDAFARAKSELHKTKYEKALRKIEA